MNDLDDWQKQWLIFRVTFPQRYPLPKLVEISFGDRLLCNGPEGKIKFSNILLTKWNKKSIFPMNSDSKSDKQPAYHPIDISREINNTKAGYFTLFKTIHCGSTQF